MTAKHLLVSTIHLGTPCSVSHPVHGLISSASEVDVNSFRCQQCLNSTGGRMNTATLLTPFSWCQPSIRNALLGLISCLWPHIFSLNGCKLPLNSHRRRAPESNTWPYEYCHSARQPLIIYQECLARTHILSVASYPQPSDPQLQLGAT